MELVGWFDIVWNARARYFLTDDQGRTIELLFDEQLVRPLGGPLALNRKRVRVIGVPVGTRRGGIHAVSIELE